MECRPGLPLSFFSWAYVRQGVYFWAYGTPRGIDFWRTPSLPIFTALHEMQTRSSDENSVCPSVRPSVKRVDCDKTVTEENSVKIFIPCDR